MRGDGGLGQIHLHVVETAKQQSSSLMEEIIARDKTVIAIAGDS